MYESKWQTMDSSRSYEEIGNGCSGSNIKKGFKKSRNRLT